MSFRLRRLPYLAQLAVVEKMDYPAILNMSFCSTRTNKLIGLANFRKVLRVCFSQNRELINVAVVDAQGSIAMGCVAQFKNPNFNYSLLTKMSSETIAFESTIEEGVFMYYYENDYHDVQKFFTEHVLRLFQHSPLIRFIGFFDDAFNTSYVVPGVEELILTSEEIDERCVEYSKRFSDLTYLNIMGPIKTDLMLQGIPAVRIENTDTWGNSILQSAGVRDLVLKDAEFGRNDILEFVRLWISGEKYQTVETLRVVLKPARIDFNPVALMNEIVLREQQIDRNTPSRIYKTRYQM